MRKIALITAGGTGLRMGADRPKQFLLLAGKPLLYHSLVAFQQAFSDMELVVVLPPAHLSWQTNLLAEWPDPPPVSFVAGGATRFHSVQLGLRHIKERLANTQEEAIVFVHDGVRCLVSPDLIRRCAQQAQEKGSAIPALAATESVRFKSGEGHYPVERDNVFLVQTPQTFRSSLLLPAFEQDYQLSFTDEATVVEANGQATFLIAGEFQNIKITRPIDLQMAALLMSAAG